MFDYKKQNLRWIISLVVPILFFAVIAGLFTFFPASTLAHGVTSGDKGYIQESTGVLILPFIYLGAKHMITGYDHLLFLFGVIFFLYKFKDIGIYVSLFALGHTITGRVAKELIN
jgi:hypothetical protein